MKFDEASRFHAPPPPLAPFSSHLQSHCESVPTPARALAPWKKPARLGVLVSIAEGDEILLVPADACT